jgi:hypothetical protein
MENLMRTGIKRASKEKEGRRGSIDGKGARQDTASS